MHCGYILVAGRRGCVAPCVYDITVSEDIVECDDATRAQPREDSLEVFPVLVLVGIDEREINVLPIG